MKNRFTIMGLVLTGILLSFMAFALANPQMSFPWPNWVSYTLYGFYVIYTVLVFCMPKMKNPNIAGCIILAFQFVALGLIVISIGIRNTPDDYNWYLPAGLYNQRIIKFCKSVYNEKKKEGYSEMR